MKRFHKYVLTMVSAVALIAGIIVPVSAYAAPTNPTPIADPFFRLTPDQYVNAPHGKLLKSRDLVAPLVPGGKATQLVFASRNSLGKPTYATAVLVRPANFPKNGQMVVFNDFINSLGIGCQPSFAYLTLNPEWLSRSAVAMWYAAIAARYGYALLIPDHEGMNAAYTANYQGAHIVLDSIRAVKNTPRFNMKKSWTGMMGYSGGAMVSLWAANLRAGYAPDVHFSAIAVGGVPTDLQYYGARLGNRSSDGFGLIFGSLVGLEREYPSINVTPRLSSHGKRKMAEVRDACAPRLIRSLKGESSSTMFKGVNFNVKSEKHAFSILRRNSLYYDKRTPSRGTKMYVFNSRHDLGAPIKPLRKTLRRYCKAGAQIQYTEVNDPDHISTAYYNLPGAAQWMFQMSHGGGNFHNDCHRIPR